MEEEEEVEGFLRGGAEGWLLDSDLRLGMRKALTAEELGNCLTVEGLGGWEVMVVVVVGC